MSKIILWSAHLCLFFVVVNGLAQSKLENVEKYAEDVLQMLMFDLEEEGFCSLLMDDLNLTINETMYGDEVVGNLRYFNGFVIGAEDVYIKPSSIQQSIAENFDARVSATVIFKGLKYAYDMEANLTAGNQKATGIFKTDDVTYGISMTKNLDSGIFTSYVSIAGSSGKGRIDFRPKNYYTTVIGRSFNGLLYSNFQKFGNGLLGDILRDVVTEKINFPTVNHEGSA